MSTGNHFLDSLPQNIQQQLSAFLYAVQISRDEYLWQQGETPKWVYFPVSAVISQYQVLQDGRTLEVAVVGREAAIGLVSALGDHGSINCAQVRVTGSALRMLTKHLLNALKREPLLNGHLVDLLGRQVAQMSRKMICNHYHTADGRLCTWLLMVADRSGSLGVSITHDQLSVILGTQRPRLSAVIKVLRDNGLITYSRGYIELTAPQRVAELACDCYQSIAETHGARPLIFPLEP